MTDFKFRVREEGGILGYSTIFIVAVILMVVSLDTVIETEILSKEEILDFEVSAGGFGAPTLCKITTTERIFTLEGFICGKLEVGKELRLIKETRRISGSSEINRVV